MNRTRDNKLQQDNENFIMLLPLTLINGFFKLFRLNAGLCYFTVVPRTAASRYTKHDIPCFVERLPHTPAASHNARYVKLPVSKTLFYIMAVSYIGCLTVIYYTNNPRLIVELLQTFAYGYQVRIMTLHS